MTDSVPNIPSTSKLTVESGVIDPTAPLVDPTQPIHTELEETSSTKNMENSTAETSPSASTTTIDKPLTLQDSPIFLDSLDIPEEVTLETEAAKQSPADLVKMGDTDNVDKQAESSAPDPNSSQAGGTHVSINEQAIHLKEAETQNGQPAQAELVPPVLVHDEPRLTVTESPRVQDATQFKEAHQGKELSRSSRLSPVQTESHVLTSPDDKLTSSPTASNPNTPDSMNQVANVQNDVAVDGPFVGVGSLKDKNEVKMAVVVPVNDETLPNPFEFLPPVSLPWYDPSQLSPRTAGSLPSRRDGRVQRLPSVLRPANRHHFDTEGSRRASMVAGWDFAPPLFPSTPPYSAGGQYSPRDRRISLEGVGVRQEPYYLPSRPQSSASWYPHYHRVNSQPVYVETIGNGYGHHNNHPRLNSQPSYFSGGSNSFPDLHRSNTSEMGYYTYSRDGSDHWDRELERERSDDEPLASEAVSTIPPVNESEAELEPEPEPEPEPEQVSEPVSETANEQGTESNVTETGDDMTKPPCPDQSSKGRWKFWSRNKQPAPCSNDQTEMSSQSLSGAASRAKIKKRLSRTLLKKSH